MSSSFKWQFVLQALGLMKELKEHNVEADNEALNSAAKKQTMQMKQPAILVFACGTFPIENSQEDIVKLLPGSPFESLSYWSDLNLPWESIFVEPVYLGR